MYSLDYSSAYYTDLLPGNILVLLNYMSTAYTYLVNAVPQNDLNLITSLPKKNLLFEPSYSAFYNLQVFNELQIKILNSLPREEVISFKRKSSS